MSEAIILGNGSTTKTEIVYNYVDRVINVYNDVVYTLQTELITSSRTWTVPNHAGDVYVRIFGGGGGGSVTRIYDNPDDVYYGAGGGGGWMNNAILTLEPGTNISITIGAGGVRGNTGGTKSGNAGGSTFFGSYLSANGGGGANMANGGNGGQAGGYGAGGGGGATGGAGICIIQYWQEA